MRILLSVIILLFININVVFASGTAGTSGADFLDIGVGSRPLGMGEAFTAQINDINSLYYNVAGLGSMKYPMLVLHHQEHILDSRYEHVNAAFSIKDGFLAIANSLFWVPSFDRIDEYGNNEGKVNFYNGVFTTGYGYDLGFMYVGGAVKYIYQRIANIYVHSVAADIGILKGMYLYSPFDTPTRNFHIGLSFQNLGSKAKDDPLPRMMRLGMSYKLTKWFGLNIDALQNLINTSDLYDFMSGFDESFRVNTGVEFNYLNILALRAGYRFNDAGTYTFGFGFNYVVGDVTFTVDSSYADTGVFGPAYSISLSFKLIPKVITVDDVRDAEVHYQNGIRYYVANEVGTALKEFKRAEEFNPYHKNIDKKIKDLEELIELQNKNEKLDLELKKIEKSFKETN